MILRKHYISDNEGLGDAEGKQWPINYIKPITAIDIFVRMTTAGTGTSAVPIPREISNISIVDGSFNLVSGIMSALCANQIAKGAVMPQLHFEAGTTKVNQASVRILFGRYFGDTEYYLDPTRFNNLLLRLTSAFTIHANNYVTALGEVTAIAHVIEQGAEPYKGVMMTKEAARPTLGVAAVSMIQLPVDYPYTGFTLCATDGTVDPDTVVARFKVDADADSLILFDEAGNDILMQNFSERGACKVNNDELADYAVSNGVGLAPGTTLLEYFSMYGAMWVNPCDIARGKFIDVGGMSSLRATLTGGSAGGATRLLTNQVYTR